MAAVIKKSAVLFVTLFISSLFLSGCGNSPSAEIQSKSITCAFVEGYLDNKVFALKSLAEGGSAADNIESLLGSISNEFTSDVESQELFVDFYEAMLSWGLSVDIAHTQNNSSAITNAALDLESEMDKFEIRCKNFGWKFKNGWRL
jgi:hypothetical protein